VDEAAKLVLVVEDHAATRAFYELFLTRSGVRVATASNCEAALRVAAESLPQLIVMDLHLPDVDGWECIRQLRLDPRTKKIPIIAMSGYPSEGDKNRALALGAAEYLVKPVGPDHLLKTLRRWLNVSAPPG
jgi:CheY-like chemotaxis protein